MSHPAPAAPAADDAAAAPAKKSLVAKLTIPGIIVGIIALEWVGAWMFLPSAPAAASKTAEAPAEEGAASEESHGEHAEHGEAAADAHGGHGAEAKDEHGGGHKKEEKKDAHGKADAHGG